MAVAVASLPQTTQIAGIHAQTAQDALLDALLSSCEKPKNPPLPSFGRDLKPYFSGADHTATSSMKAQKASNHKGVRPNKVTPPPVAAAAAAAAASTKQSRETTKTATGTSAATTKKVSAAKGKVAAPKKDRTVPEAATLLDKPLPPLNKGEMAAFLSWAGVCDVGPGFYVAPSPDKLPLPTNLLLE